tara:strand:- start:16744 stop:17175 length:432 start_codon:yes stop_codon:yes gene_type:complete
MKKLLLTLAAVAALGGCKSTGQAYEQAKTLNYPDRPTNEQAISAAEQFIAPTLKDPSSLKLLKISNAYKCYASNMGVTDNISPKYDYGYWCYFYTYNATNSYGGSVRGGYDLVFDGGQFITVNQLNETVRKFDDVWTYRAPLN